MRALISIAFGMSIIALSISVSAEDEGQGLVNTEQRLSELIGMAAKQDLVTLSTIDEVPQVQDMPLERCLADVAFLSKGSVISYSDVILLKNAKLLEDGSLDLEKSRALAMVYLSLGFGPEAIVAAGALPNIEQREIGIVARSLTGASTSQDQEYFEGRPACGQNIWKRLSSTAADGYVPLHEFDMAQLKTLPAGILNIIGHKMGLDAAFNGDPKAAEIFEILSSAGPKHHETGLPILNDDQKFLSAVLRLGSDDTRSLAMVKTFASHDNPNQGWAVLALSKFASETQYDGYLQDLDSAAQTYASSPAGQLALSEKINYYAQNSHFQAAIEITIDSFTKGDAYYLDSVITITGFVVTDLEDTQDSRRLQALNIVLEQAVFFEDLEDNSALMRAGVLACARLNLPSLAAKLMPTSDWYKLDDHTLQSLALATAKWGNQADLAAHFPKHILLAPELKIIQAQRILSGGDSLGAQAMLKALPQNESVEKTRMQMAWRHGIWAHSHAPMKDGKEPSLERQLAASFNHAPRALSQKYSGIKEQGALRGALDDDGQLFAAYMAASTVMAGGQK